MPGPLSDVVVVELGGIGPVPHAGMVLADLGATVTRVEAPDGTRPAPWSASDILGRGKRSVAVDLHHPEGVDLVLDLIGGADVVLEGFRPGVAERLGLGPEVCLERRPSLVYGRMTGWGQDGPLAQRAGHDIDYIAVSGALAAVGPSRAPLPPLNLVGDFGGGSMLLLTGVLSALHAVAGSGRGQVVDAAMVDGSALLMAMHHAARAAGWWVDARGSNLLDGGAPFYTTYPTSDGEWMAVGALEDRFYAELLEGLGLSTDELPDRMDPSSWPDLRARLAAVFADRSRGEWEQVFEGTDACVVGVYTMAEAPDHPHLRRRGTFIDVDGSTQPAPAPRFSGTPTAMPRPAPAPGSDTAEILGELGRDDATISRLRDSGVIG
jgi:alpha-methylacyl-CoA racemase